MCLAIPGQVLEFIDDAPLTRRARVSFGGLIKEINLSLVPEADVGCYVLTHVGVAISVIDEAEAQRTLAYLEDINDLPQAEDSAP